MNAGDPLKFLYAPDKTREVRGAESWRLYTVRLTAQATRKDKLNLHWDEQHPCNGSTFSTSEDGCRNQPESGSVYGPLGLGGLSSTTSPEIGGYLNAHPRVRQLTWSETATNRMLFEAGVGLYQAPFGPYESPGNKTRPLARWCRISRTSPTIRTWRSRSTTGSRRSSRRACCPTRPATARGTCRSTCRTSGRTAA